VGSQNFDNAANWVDPASTPLGNDQGSGAPAEVQFKDVAGHHDAVEIQVTGGKYELGKLMLEDGVGMSLESDSAIYFNEQATGAPAVFTGGQSTKRPACSVGCQANFYGA